MRGESFERRANKTRHKAGLGVFLFADGRRNSSAPLRLD